LVISVALLGVCGVVVGGLGACDARVL